MLFTWLKYNVAVHVTFLKAESNSATSKFLLAFGIALCLFSMTRFSASCTVKWTFFNAFHEILTADPFARHAPMSRSFGSATKACQQARYDDEHDLKKKQLW